MAEYKRQATNKYYGAGNAGYVSTGKDSDGLAKALTNAGYSLGKASSLKIDREKDDAAGKIKELQATGKTFETIQAEIISGEHPELTGKYVQATANYHAGRVKAAEVRNTILEARTNGEYDINDKSSNLDIFYKKYMPDTKAMDSATLLGFTSQFNTFRSEQAIDDANARADIFRETKTKEGVSLLDGIDTDNLKKELPDFLKNLQPQVPNSDGGSTPNLLYTNQETINVVKRGIEDIIANSVTEDDLDRADILINTNLGYSKSGSAIGTISSRNTKDIIALEDKLTKRRRTLMLNDRTEIEYERKIKTRKLNASLYSQVDVQGLNGETYKRDKTHLETNKIRDELEAMGEFADVAAFDRARTQNAYANQDPAVITDIIKNINTGAINTLEDAKEAANNANASVEDYQKIVGHYEFTEENPSNMSLHLKHPIYTKSITTAVALALAPFTAQGGDIAKSMKPSVTAFIENHMIGEIYEFEKSFKENNDGRFPTNPERYEYMQKVIKYLTETGETGENKFAAGVPEKEIKTLATKNADDDKAIKDAETERFNEEAKEAELTALATRRLEVEFPNLLNVATASLNDLEVDFPDITRHRTNNNNFPFDSISKEDFDMEQVVPFIQETMKGLFPEGVFNSQLIEFMPQESLDKIIIDVSKKLGVSEELVVTALGNVK